MQRSDSTPVLRPFWTAGAAALLLSAGCATRPPRQVGPPASPVMPPPAAGQVEDDLPPPLEVDFNRPEMDPTVPAPPPRPAPRPAPQPREGTPYTIRKGESLSAIAARNRMSWKRLADYNHIANPDRVRAGQVILIPGGGASASSSSRRPAPAPTPANSGDTYVVQSGDSLSRVAQRYGTTVSELKSVNGLRSDRLLVGQILKLPAGSSARAQAPRPAPTPVPEVPVVARPTPEPARVEPTPEPEVPVLEDPAPEAEADADVDPMADQPYEIVVMEGDTLESIAANYVVSVEEIRKLNQLPAGAELTPGQKLKMPVGIY